MNQYDFVGVDVSKDKFDVSVAKKGSYKHHIFANSSKGHNEFLNWLDKNAPCAWVGMEATGHYSTELADFLSFNNIRVSVINAYQIKSFARASLARNKNDNIDSQIIAQFVQRMEPRIYESSSDGQKEVKALTNVLDILKKQLTQLKNQLQSTQSKLARKALIKMIKQLEKEIASIQKQIEDHIEENEQLSEQCELLTSIKGIGKLTAFRILALMPSIECFTNAKQFAAYIGITPKHNQSGTFAGKTTISRIGNARLRNVFYMPALVAKNTNKALNNFVCRLHQRNKSPKAIICAVMRKLAHIVFGVLKNKTPFNENLACF